MAPKRLKALLDDQESVGLNEVVCGCCSPLQRVAGGCAAAPNYRCEAAGRGFAARFEAWGTPSSPSSPSSGSDSEAEAEAYAKDAKGKSQDKSSGGYLRISELLKGVNLYNLMGISEGASQDEIKKAYRGLALTAHPDKQAAMEPEEAKKVQENFVKIQEAYELLSDPSKRKQYDSSLDFDESLPKFRPDSGQDFFKVFGEAFRRNARFSVRRPVPDLGSLEDEPRVWKRFYDFWSGFQSWRDPVMLAQKAGEEICDLDEAECREERRWMIRENQRVARQYKQQERDRIAKLVRDAETFDPRIQAEKEAKRLAREAEAARREEERTAAKRAKEEAERQRREAEEALRLAEEQKRREEKAKRDAVKERVKKCRQRLRSFHPAVKEYVVLEQLNEVCLQFDEEQLRDLGNQIEQTLKGSALEAASLFHKAIESIGLTPMKVSEDAASTTSGPTDSQEEAPRQVERETSQERKERERRAAEEQAKRRIVEEQQAAEKARLAAEKAEEKKKKEEQRKKDAAAAEAARRAQEKKDELKAKKAEEKQKKQEEEEKLRKEQQREVAKQKAQEQAQRDRQAAQEEKEKLELERLINLFAKDRLERLGKLDPLSDEKLASSLQAAVDEDKALAGALQLLKGKLGSCEENACLDPLDRAIALVSDGAGAGSVWPLAVAAPSHLRLENALRNRVKKARNRLRDAVGSFLKSCKLPNADEGAVTEWQQGIVNGLLELPPWSPQEPELPKAAPGPDKKKKKDKAVEEDLDQILAEFDDSSPAESKSKKSGKKKK
ncbi:Dnajc2 [Symbiodinium natans]|uniref:Dnajc2 protein n=1 Tax=Symbiodinium natans TaxID=878477 RepID=A0A812GTT9_9DINO|nr:Dnajc2 [Symbiodinium natans]